MKKFVIDKWWYNVIIMNDDWEQTDSQENSRFITPSRRPIRIKADEKKPGCPVAVILLLLLAAALVIGGIHYFYAHQSTRAAIYLNDKPLVYLAATVDAQQAIMQLRQQYAPSNPNVVKFLDNKGRQVKLSVRAVPHPAEVVDVTQAIEAIKQHTSTIVDVYVIVVNRKPWVALETRDDAGKTLSLMLQKGLNGRSGIPTIKEKVRVLPFKQSTRKFRLPIMTPENAADLLVFPPRPREYHVKAGDNYWKIAARYYITRQQLTALNPDVNPARLKAGDRLKVPDLQSPVTIVVRGN